MSTAAAGALALAAAPAEARLTVSGNALTYVQARAAAANGDHARAARLLASLAAADPAQVELRKQALEEALGAGQFELALKLAHALPAANLSTDARLLIAGEAIRQSQPERAASWLSAKSDSGDLTFLLPLITAWSAAERGNLAPALAALDNVPAASLLAPLVSEERALILLKFKRTADAETAARQALQSAGGRDARLRLAFADGFVAAGDPDRALAMIEGMGAGEVSARQRIRTGKQSGQGIDNLAKAYSDVISAFAAEVSRAQRSSAPIGLVQVARYVDPQSSSTVVLLALLLASQSRAEEAFNLLSSINPKDALSSQVRDVQTRVLIDAKRLDEAYRIAEAAAVAPNADAQDYSRLGDVLQALKRHAEAAEAYEKAITIARQQRLNGIIWTLLLLRASSLEEANRWPEARASLEEGLRLAPDEPLLLNFLGYAELERGQNMDAAEAMIRKASELAPDDASITDSLGWAQFKRGKLGEAIATLQHAAEKDPKQAEIQEHLGDALYRSGRRYEARYAWHASLVTAEDDIAARIKSKLASGLTPANAAP